MLFSPVSFSHLHYSVIQRVCEAIISGYFVVLARNFLARTLDYIVMQIKKLTVKKAMDSDLSSEWRYPTTGA